MLSDVAIQAEGLGKLYQLGTRFEPRMTLREQINRLVLSPYHRLQAVLRGESAQISGDDLWALKDVSLTVSYGEVVGVIGRNGAGKSTLLKILSRITEPTEGRAEIRGRVGSLLEVGTGFHSELTGRENIFLNGVILGMTRSEIAARLDEIVAFSEVERFLDTQVKHYSTGMSLRLAFAVAAHLQPEILLVDEVLAVGDAAFRRKCLGKMSDVARTGRAILFVSHNLDAVQRLCDRCIWIDDGRIRQEGDPHSVIRAYLEHGDELDSSYRGERRSGPDEPAVLQEAAILDSRGEVTDTICFGEPFSLRLRWDVARSLPGATFMVFILDASDRIIFSASTQDSDLEISAGTTETICNVRQNVLLSGDYRVSVSCMRPPRTWLHHVDHCIRLRVLNVPLPGKTVPHVYRDALVAPNVEWEHQTPVAMAAGARRHQIPLASNRIPRLIPSQSDDRHS
jgi:lipopolysaccharide transport system ATP-binding protein